jgi:NADH dehydrogenase
MSETVVITGAFSYTGRYATRLLLDRGYRVRTLTNHPPVLDPARADPFGGKVQALPYNFNRPEELRRSLEGASTLINTYWVRFPRGVMTYTTAVENSRILIQAAREAGMQRIAHVSIANPSLDSPLAYYKGKAEVEQAVAGSGLGYTILRPTVIFGAEDILINNIAWFVRKFPVFAIPGDGRYGVRPICVEDMARLLADGVEQSGNTVIDAVGPENFALEELVRLIARSVGRRVNLVHVPVSFAYLSTLLTGWLVKDVVLTWEEYKGLMSNLLASEAPAAGEMRLSEWLTKNGDHVGRKYASEVERHYASVPYLRGTTGASTSPPRR